MPGSDDIDLQYAEVAAYRCPDCDTGVAVSADPYDLGFVRCADCDEKMDRVDT